MLCFIPFGQEDELLFHLVPRYSDSERLEILEYVIAACIFNCIFDSSLRKVEERLCGNQMLRTRFKIKAAQSRVKRLEYNLGQSYFL